MLNRRRIYRVMRYHLAQERHRVHQSRYAGHVIPHAA
jgi:hypothetical protein